VNPIVLGGFLIGGLCSTWLVINGVSGFYKDPQMSVMFVPIVSTIEIVVLILALRKTAALGRSYSGQVVAGTLMALLGGAIIFCASLFLTSVLYPNYFAEINQMSREVMLKNKQSEEQIAAAINAVAGWQTPGMSALAGFIGTVTTGIVASAIIAIWIRARNADGFTARA
jgi:TM2 domain-containing membrane protein YozV